MQSKFVCKVSNVLPLYQGSYIFVKYMPNVTAEDPPQSSMKGNQKIKIKP